MQQMLVLAAHHEKVYTKEGGAVGKKKDPNHLVRYLATTCGIDEYPRKLHTGPI